MSVINQMLKDLERRHATNEITKNKDFSEVRVAFSSTRSFRWFWLTILFLMLVGALLFLFLKKPPPSFSYEEIQLPKTNVQIAQKKQTDTSSLQQPVITESLKLADGERKLSPSSEKNIVKIKQQKPTMLIQPQSIDQKYQRALDLRDRGKTNEAEKLLIQLLKEDSEHQKARLTLALLLQRQDRLDESIKILDKGLFYSSDYMPFIKLKAEIMYMQKSYENALSVLQISRPELSDDPEYYSLMAAIYQHLNKSEISIRIYNRLLILNSDNGVWWVGMGVNLEKLNRYDEAIQAYIRAGGSDQLSPELQAYVLERLNILRG